MASAIIGRESITSNPRVEVRLAYEADAADGDIHYAVVVSGGDKHHWYGIPAGGARRVTLRPGEDADTDVTFFYQLTPAGEMRVWEGEENGGATVSVTGYRIDIVLRPDGRVFARYGSHRAIQDDPAGE